MKLDGRILALAAVAFIMLCTIDVSAGNPIRKISRGIANIGFGGLELPIQVYDVTKEEGGISGATYGVVKGVAYTVARILVGATEVVTFPMPLPGCPDDPRDSGWGYGAIMRPEWVVDPEHNAYNIFYQDTEVIN